jgi:hypothetical protein
MKLRLLWIVIFLVSVSCAAQCADIRTYRQFRDISTKENGKVVQSTDKKNLFECTYQIDYKNNTITRIKVMRLDESAPRDDATVYNITEKKRIYGSEAGYGGKVLVAVQKGGGEILELGSKFAFTTRTSPFSQVITGVYKRVYVKEDNKWHKEHPNVQ